MATEKEKMVAGLLYCPLDEELEAGRVRSRGLQAAYNETTDDQEEERKCILKEWFGSVGECTYIEPPIYVDYGSQIKLGNKVYMNFNCVILDICPVDIGDETMFGPAVQVYAATHPLSHSIRTSGIELGKPIKIGSGCWIGGGAIICPGVTIGDKTVIGAGSVVTKDIPACVVAVGNPCRVIRELKDGELANEFKEQLL